MPQKELPKLTFLGASITAALLLKKTGIQSFEQDLKTYKFFQHIDAVEWAFRACPKDVFDIAKTIHTKGYFSNVQRDTLGLWIGEVIDQLESGNIEFPMSWLGEIYSPEETKVEPHTIA
jgi:hypothetical protein